MLKPVRAAAACGLGLLSAAAWAQESVPLEPVQVTAARGAEPSFQAPQPLTVLTEQELQSLNPQVMAEALRNQVGAYFQQTGPGQGVVISRGLKGAEVLHLVDGFRLNNAFFRTAPSQYIALLDPYNISQLELLRGPYASLYGSDAMGGVVQVLTPEHRFNGDTPAVQGGLRFNYNSQDLSTNSRVWAATGYRDFSIAAGITALDAGRRKLAEPGQSPDGRGTFPQVLEERVNDTAYRARGVDLKAIMSLSPQDELMLSLQSYEIPQLPRYNETVSGYGTATPSGTVNGTGRSRCPAVAISIYDNSRRFYHARYRHTAPLAFVDSLELHLGHQVITDDRFDRALDLSRDVFEYNRSSLSGLTLVAQTRLDAHQLQYGLEVYTDRVDSRSLRETPPGSGSFTFNSPASFQSRFPQGARADDFGLYVFDQWTLNERWGLEGGTRYNYHKSYIPQADRALGAVIADRDVTGNLGLRYAISPSLAWSANLGHGFRAPNVNDLAQVGARSGGRLVVSNLALRPERLTSVDTGFKFARAALSGEATLFYSDYQDRISLERDVFTPGQGECPPAPNTTNCSQNQNITQAEYYGFEGGLRYRLSPAFSTRAVLNYTWGQQEKNGAKQPGNRTPPLNGLAAAEYRAEGGWSLESYVHFAGRQDRLDADDKRDNRINPNGTPGWATLNLRALWPVHPQLSLQLDGYNLLDQAYREHASGIDGAARGLGLGLRAQF